MNLSSQSIADAPSSHVDLDAVLAVLRDHPEAIAECRIAFSLILAPNQRGIRALERSAGVAFNSVLDTLSCADWGLSPHGLVQTVERGKSWDSDGREVSIYRLAGSVREQVTKQSLSNKELEVQEAGGPGALGGLKNPKQKTDGDSLAHRFPPGGLALLDPALDIWSRKKTELGPEGWRIAMLTGLKPLDLSAKEWAELAGGADRAKRLAKKLLAFGVGVMTRTGRARSTRYVLDWSGVLDNEMFNLDLFRTREWDLMDQHTREQRRITQPLTAEEIRATKGPGIAAALLAELDGTESPEHFADVHRLADLYRDSTAEDWARWNERVDAVRV